MYIQVPQVVTNLILSYSGRDLAALIPSLKPFESHAGHQKGLPSFNPGRQLSPTWYTSPALISFIIKETYVTELAISSYCALLFMGNGLLKVCDKNCYSSVII